MCRSRTMIAYCISPGLGRDEWREEKKQRHLKSLKESKSPRGKDKRRAWNLQRAIRRGDYDFFGKETKQNNKQNEDYEDD